MGREAHCKIIWEVEFMYPEFIPIYAGLAVLIGLCVAILILLVKQSKNISGYTMPKQKKINNSGYTNHKSRDLYNSNMAFCKKCATQFSASERFCPKCGTPR
jgi:NADH pyrophosphatase NudC (nudix superfamily)